MYRLPERVIVDEMKKQKEECAMTLQEGAELLVYELEKVYDPNDTNPFLSFPMQLEHGDIIGKIADKAGVTNDRLYMEARRIHLEETGFNSFLNNYIYL